MSTAVDARPARRRLAVTGVVQGVGFRPFAHRLAGELGLVGFVRNDAGGACVEVEGPADALARFAARLGAEAPAPARVDAIEETALPVLGESGFTICASDARTAGAARTLVPADLAPCDACLAEVDDPADRRHRHPFANCTACGPRFTVIRALPYDRPATTMAPFAMCPACAREYADPADRRHHAQPICCPQCGPRLWFEAGSTRIDGDDAAIAAAQRVWAQGGTVAVKGVGGWHLMCDAADDAAVARLRERKGRGDKPFALLARDADAARAVATLGDDALALLTSPARPIVLAPRAPGAAVSAHVAPHLDDLGVMLAPSALHHLLLRPVPGEPVMPPPVLVATSGNRAAEPICTGDDEARERLAGLADAFLGHDREITRPCDDSVLRAAARTVHPVRRSRGYAPLPLRLPVAVPPTLAAGGELKATFCLADGREAWMSQHLGDLETLEALDAYAASVRAFEALHRITPRVVAVDRHPGYLSRRWAIEHAGETQVVEVQHHHAHAAALLAEHGRDGDEPIVALVFDGTGYGPAAGGDGAAAWGGEILLADLDGFERAGRLAELPLPGADEGVRNPCRVALAWLAACGLPAAENLGPVRATSDVERGVVARQVQTGAGVVPTTSMGRLFDVAAALLGVRQRVTYEGQAAIELEALARRAAAPAGDLRLDVSPAGVLDPAPLLAGLLDGLDAGLDRAGLALGVHHAVADAAAAAAADVARAVGVRTVGLTGGVFQNALLAARCRAALGARGLAVLEHERVPANDGGLALGQAVIAGRVARRRG